MTKNSVEGRVPERNPLPALPWDHPAVVMVGDAWEARCREELERSRQQRAAIDALNLLSP